MRQGEMEAAGGGIRLFAYGLLMDPGVMRQLCPNARAVGPARLERMRIAFRGGSREDGGGVADVLPARDRVVWGVLWELPERSLAALDAFEEVPEQYVRVRHPVRLSDGAEYEAELYRQPEGARPAPPGERYLGRILAAAQHWGLPSRYQDELRAAATLARAGRGRP